MNKILIFYLVAISLLAVILTASDKHAARQNAWRIKELTLLLVSVLGGAAAMLLTMLALRHKTRRLKFMAGIPLIILIQAVIIVFGFNHNLSISYYNVETDKINGQIKLALVADLHSCDYGEGQSKLLSAITREEPDVILFCGDIFDDKLPPQNTIELLEGISSKYPCFYVSGNHEFWSGKADEFKDIFKSHGVIVLEGNSKVVEIHGEALCIGGIDDPDTDRYASLSAQYSNQMNLLKASFDYKVFTILLSHRPERITELLALQPNLVVSGHAHGGQWRIPYILSNGLFSPNQGFFPKYTNGEYFFGDRKLIVSRGLARESTALPRVFNRPEIVVITLRAPPNTHSSSSSE